MKRSALYFFTLLVAFGCNKGPKLPLSEEVIVRAMADTHVAGAAVQNLTGVYKDSMKQEYFKQILEIHQIEEADFRAAMDSLAHNPVAMERIVRKVENVLAELEAQSIENQTPK